MRLSILFSVLFLSGLILASCNEQATLVKGDATDGPSFMEEQAGDVDVAGKHKILIVPFQDEADKAVYPNSEIYQTMLFTSFYSIFSIHPSIQIPDKSVLLSIETTEDTLSELAKQYKCEYIVFGNYGLKGSKTKPNADIELKIWNNLTGTIVTNSLSTPTDADFFDALDLLQSKAISAILNEDMQIAYLNFNNFITKGEKLGLYINRRLVAEPVSNDFKLNLKVIAGKDYNISVKRLRDGKHLNGILANLEPGETLNFSATNRRINLIPKPDFDPETFSSGSWSNPEGTLNLQVENGVCHVQFRKKNLTNIWDIQLMASPFRLIQGKKYLITFNARGTESGDIFVNIAGSNPPYTAYLPNQIAKKIAINTEMLSYKVEFRMPATENAAKFEFDLGKARGELWFSDVVIEEVL